jgi:hypothetical protein
MFASPSETVYSSIAVKKDDVVEPGLPHVHSGVCNSRYRLYDNRHLHDCVESIIRNLGGPLNDVKESGSSGLETTPKTFDASKGSQRGHSTLSGGKPHTWGRATP